MLPDFVPCMVPSSNFFFQEVALFGCGSNVFSFEDSSSLGCPPLRFWESTDTLRKQDEWFRKEERFVNLSRVGEIRPNTETGSWMYNIPHDFYRTSQYSSGLLRVLLLLFFLTFCNMLWICLWSGENPRAVCTSFHTSLSVIILEFHLDSFLPLTFRHDLALFFFTGCVQSLCLCVSPSTSLAPSPAPASGYRYVHMYMYKILQISTCY